ncbi:MAG: hypothetical protein JST84_05310 [Acidobacteria bacterium]|nr:hypothetical protein [Acidobacteriota bacterium]
MPKLFKSTLPSVVGDDQAIIAYEQTHNTSLPAISLVEWEFTHNDFKGVSSGINPDLPAGIPTIMGYDNGTVLHLVRVVRNSEAVTNKVAEIEKQIAALNADIEWANAKCSRDQTLGHYIADCESKISQLKTTVAKVQKMAE